MKNQMNQMFKQAQKLQEQMLKAQEELVNIKVEGTSGGGMVSVAANAKQEILSIKIEKDVVDPDDIEMLEDLVVAAVNQALSNAQEAANKHLGGVTGGMLGNLPPGMKIPGF
ncbi:YbaB/EbfC family nucleoid-associated protein [candidate division KSB1 bacterium]